MYYDAKFGRKRLPESEDTYHRNPDGAASNGSPLSTVPNGHASRRSELSTYEQYRQQVEGLMYQLQFAANCGILCYSKVVTGLYYLFLLV